MSKRKLKIVMLGEGRVGKTSLLHRFIDNAFDENCASTTKATMYAQTKMEVKGSFVDVAIWDTAGQERYHALGPIYYRDAHGAVLTYDITDKESFARVKVWLKELHQVVGENISIVVVGNKCDLERERKVNAKEAEQWAAENNAKHFLCSAKLGIRVSEAFADVVERSMGLQSSVSSSDSMNASMTGRSNTTRAAVKITLDEPSAKKTDEGCKC